MRSKEKEGVGGKTWRGDNDRANSFVSNTNLFEEVRTGLDWTEEVSITD